MSLYELSQKQRILQRAEFAVVILLLAAALFFCITAEINHNELAASSAHSIEGYALQARAACIYHPESKRFLYEASAAEHLAPASTIKLLTALTAMDFCDEEDIVTVGEEINNVPADASRAWLLEGDVLTVRQLLYAMLLPSGNDAAYALAAFCGRKIAEDSQLSTERAIDRFVLEMNNKSKALGAYNSCFLTPDGYDKEGQFSTAQDLALIAAEFCSNEKLLQIVGCFESTEKWQSGREAIYYNTNDLLNPDSPFFTENALGLKTGTSSRAGACLIAAAKIKGEFYITVVLGSREDDRYRDCLILFSQAEALKR